MEFALRSNDGRVHALRVSEEAEYETNCGETFDPLGDDGEVELVMEEEVEGNACQSCGWEGAETPEQTEE